MPVSEDLNGRALIVLSPAETKERLDRGEIVLIDVREPAEYAAEHIHGALLAPLSELDGKALPDQKEKLIVFQCGSGKRSKMAAERAGDAGLAPLHHMDGGLGAWKAAGLPYQSIDPATGKPVTRN